MNSQPTPAAVVNRTIRVEVPIEEAFKIFAERIGDWWPASHHIAVEPFSAIVMEKRAGGRWSERDSNGTVCDWGRVLEFSSIGPAATWLEFEHRYLEHHGEGYEKIRAGVDSPGGWTAVLAQYVAVAAKQKS